MSLCMPHLVGRCPGQHMVGCSLESGVVALPSPVSSATFCFASKPVDNQQALVRRESVVNLENFKKQYVRRRWKVDARAQEWGQGPRVGS